MEKAEYTQRPAFSPEHQLFWCSQGKNISEQVRQKFAVDRFEPSSVANDAITLVDEDYRPFGIMLLESPEKDSPQKQKYRISSYKELMSDDTLHLPSIEDLPPEAVQLLHIPALFEYIQDYTQYHMRNASLQSELHLLHQLLLQDEYGLMAFRESIQQYTQHIFSGYRPMHVFIHKIGASDVMPIPEVDYQNKAVEVFSLCARAPGLRQTILAVLHHPESEALLLEIHKSLYLAEEIIDDVLESYENVALEPPTRESLRSAIFEASISLLREFLEYPEDMESLIRKFSIEGQEIRFTKELVDTLNDEDKQNLRAEDLKTVHEFEISGKELLQLRYKIYLDQLRQIVLERFPEGDIDDFEEFLNDKNTSLALSVCGNRIIYFFGLEKKKNNIIHVDWVATPSQKPIQELRAVHSFEERMLQLSEDHHLFLVTRPHGKIFHSAVNNLGFVASGRTREYRNTYWNCRKHQKERDVYRVPQYSSSDRSATIHKVLEKPEGEMMITSIEGNEVAVFRLNFYGISANDDYRNEEIEKLLESFQSNNSWVITWREDDGKGNMYYFCERSTLEGEEYENFLRDASHESIDI